MSIPVLNIYYLLTYAWNKLDEGEKIRAGSSDYNQIVDLFAKLLINGCNRLLNRGMNCDYVPHLEAYAGIKGKIDFTSSLNGNLFRQGKAVCQFDEFARDILINQIIKATLIRLTNVSALDQGLRKNVKDLYWKLDDVSDIELRAVTFKMIRIHRNNSFYDLLMKICQMIFEATTLQENGEYHFTDFIREPKAMAYLFQEFIKNFYAIELQNCKVHSPKILWDALPIGESDISFLPQMQTDICIESASHKIVIDTKYYSDTVSTRYSTPKFHSDNLYQIYSYLRNLERDATSPLNKNIFGILLYPTVGDDYDQSFQMGNHVVRIATVDLSKHWRTISDRLKDLVETLRRSTTRLCPSEWIMG